MPNGHDHARDLTVFHDAGAAVERIASIYAASVEAIRRAFMALTRENATPAVEASYPYLGVTVGRSDLHVDARLSYGVLIEPGHYGTTLTRPALSGPY